MNLKEKGLENNLYIHPVVGLEILFAHIFEFLFRILLLGNCCQPTDRTIIAPDH